MYKVVIKIKILMVHNYYQQSGGEDQVFSNEINLLTDNGNKVMTYSISNKEISNDKILDKIKVGLNSIWSYSQYRDFKRYLYINKPDVVHVHNFFPLISPSIYYACNQLNIPVVQTLHNYRLICPAATFLRNNEVCEECLGGSLINSIKHGCYRDSRIQTIPVASMIAINKRINTWSSKVDKYIALTEFSKRKFVESGIKENKIAVKPNFVIQSQKDNRESEKEDYLLYVGRISIEKGVNILLEAWRELENKEGLKLVIVGDGPEKEKLTYQFDNCDDITFKGKLDHNTTLSYIRKAKYLVFPSIWYEGFPMTILESYSLSTPVIASKIGSIEEIVKNNVTGFHFQKGDKINLINILNKAINYRHYDAMLKKTNEEYLKNYTSDINYQLLMNIYNDVIEQKESINLI